MSREDRPINDRIFAREFGRNDVTAALDAMTIDGVCRALCGPSDDGQPSVIRTMAQGQGGWRIGDGRPSLADDDPAVMQAIGRCAAYQVRLKLPGLKPMLDVAHPGECAWCGYPVAEMMRACDWATVISRYVVTERLTWHQWPSQPVGQRGLSYSRGGLDDRYLNDAWAEFSALEPDQRMARVHACQYPDTEAPR